MTAFPDYMTLGQARSKIDDAISDGKKIECPCCNRGITIRTERLNNIRLRMLIAFFRYNPTGWMHKDEINSLMRTYAVVPDTNIGSGDFAKNAYWDLIEEAPSQPGKRNTGTWRMTQKGRDFVEGKFPLKPAMKYYNKTFIEWTDTPSAFVQELLKKDMPLDEALVPAALKDFFEKTS